MHSLHAPGRGRQVFIETYGCQMNVADSQLMSGILGNCGYRVAASADDADIILINTCAVRERAEDRVLARLANLKPYKDRNGAILGVCGCMAEHVRERLFDAAPYVDLIVGPDSYRRLPDLINEVAEGHPVVDIRLDKEEVYEGVAPSRVDGVNGWISIQRGCDKFCTFCIVPFVRGRERSCSPREILRQARALAEQGAAELTLLGQTVNSYAYEGVDFADLLVAVSEVDGVKRVRFTSPYPLDFSDKLIETMGALPKLMPYIHLPLQSGCDDVLQTMRRGHTLAEFRTLVGKLRAATPGLALSTDLIVGFPGESRASFERTLEAVRELRFDSAFMFLYSERSHTYARRHLSDDVPLEEKKARLTELIGIQETISAEVNATYVGRTVPVLIAGKSRRSDTDWTGKSDTFKSTVFPVDPMRPEAPGDVVDVEVLDTTSHTLLGVQRPV